VYDISHKSVIFHQMSEMMITVRT